MSKRSFAHVNWTPGATADNSTLNAGYMGLRGGSSTQLLNVREVSVQGMASAASATPLVLAFSSTIATGTTALASPDADGFVSPGIGSPLAAAAVSYTTATSNPTRSNVTTSPKMTFGINAFGGVLRHNFTPGEELQILGNTASLGEVTLSCYTGGSPGLIQSHIIYEPL